MSLQLDGITKQYHAFKALDSVNFHVQGSKVIVLIGVNGAGKTTLMRIMAGLDVPDKGTIKYNNQAISDGQLRQIGTLVFQRTAMFSRSIYDNLAYGLKLRGKKDTEISEKITEALHSVGLRNFEKRKAIKTSGGEMQRIALARAFLLEPKILLLDEPTANLDPNSAMIIERAIAARKNPETIIVIATHNLGQAKRLGDEVVHIHGGRILERATRKDFFEHPTSEVTRKFLSGELEF